MAALRPGHDGVLTMAWNWTEWKRWPHRNGAYVAVLTALGIAGGALLWFERDAPRYPTARDIAELSGAVLERRQAATSAFAPDWQWSGISNRIGYYPSREFFHEWLPEQVNALRWSQYLDLWGNDTSSGIDLLRGRFLSDDDRFFLENNEFINQDWWRSNIWERAGTVDLYAPIFGDYEYLYTNQTAYPSTRSWYVSANLLNDAAKPLAAMRWMRAGYGHLISANTNANHGGGIQWIGVATSDYSKAHACGLALLRLGSATPVWEHTTDAVEDLAAELENANLRHHWISVSGSKWYNTNLWTATAIEEVNLARRLAWVAPMTNLNVSVYEVMALERPGYFVEDSEQFYHPKYDENEWNVIKCDPEPVGPEAEYTGYAQYVNKWDGKFNWLPLYDALVTDEKLVGWTVHYAASDLFIIDWEFQCLNNYYEFWP